MVNIALLVVAVIAVGATVIAATSRGRSSQSGNAQACSAFWAWDNGTGPTAQVLGAYRQATTQPLLADLYNVSVGLRDQGKGLNGDKRANAAFARQFASKAETDCTKAGYPSPAT